MSFKYVLIIFLSRLLIIDKFIICIFNNYSSVDDDKLESMMEIELEYCKELKNIIESVTNLIIDDIKKVLNNDDEKLKKIISLNDEFKRDLNNNLELIRNEKKNYLIINDYNNITSNFIINFTNKLYTIDNYNFKYSIIKITQTGLYIQILLLKMYYHICLIIGQSLNLILPSITYLFIFNNGLYNNIIYNNYNITQDNINKFINLHSESTNELIQRCIEGIKEHDILNVNQQLTTDFISIHEQFNKFYKPILELTGNTIHNIEL